LLGKEKVKNLYSLQNYIDTNQRLYELEDIINTDHIYTYIIYEKRETDKDGNITNQEYKFAARPVYNSMESFAKHYSIYYQIVYKEYGVTGLQSLKKDEEGITYEHKNIGIILSGEIQMRGSNIIRYNFASGTYMKDRFQDLSRETIYQYSIMFDQIIKDIYKYKGKTLYDPNIKDTFINPENIQNIETEINEIWSKLDKNKLPLFLLFNSKESCIKSSKFDLLDMITSYNRIKLGVRSLLIRPNSKQLLEGESVGLTEQIIGNIDSNSVTQVERKEILDKLNKIFRFI
jgi:hypothetical protein